MRKFPFKELFLDFLLGIGLVFVISPIVGYWFIHGDYERYIWIINGPYPFSNFGGGPFQLFMFLSLFAIGVVLIIISVLLNKNK